MAVDPVDKPKTEWTVASVVLLASSAVLLAAAGLFGWLAWTNWRFKSNLLDGLQEAAQGRPGAARAALKAALSYRPEDLTARQLLAKIECEDGNLSEAAKHYQVLRKQGSKSGAVAVGLGVTALKEALKLEDPKAVDAKIKEAQAEFRSPTGLVPEADLGLAHAELVAAYKLKDPARLPAAKAAFEKIRAAVESKADYRAALGREGLVDYSMGLGKALASGGAYDPAASAAYRGAHQYARRWHAPLANVLGVETRRLQAFAGDREAMGAAKSELNALKVEAGTVVRAGRDAREAIGEAWFQYCLALGAAWGRAGVHAEAHAVLRDAASTQGFEGRLEPAILDARIRTDLALVEDPVAANQERAVGVAVQGYSELLNKLGTDEARRALRVRALNNLAWMQAWRSGYSGSSTYLSQALDRLSEALKLEPQDPVLNRNACVLLKRLKKPPASWQAHLELAKAAGPDAGADLDALVKYLGSE